MNTYTIKDIAQRAEVSKTTVSRYLNNKFDMMSFETREKIRKIIEELDYKPNVIAQGLANRKTRTIGICLADISNPFTSIMIKGVYDECKKHNYGMMFANSDNNPEQEKESIKSFLDQKVAGLIINTSGNNDNFILNFDNKNVVLVDRIIDNLRIDTVTSDNYKSTFEAIRFMQKVGYQDIYFVAEPLESVTTRQIRYTAFKDAIKEKSDSKLITINSKQNIDINKKVFEIVKGRSSKVGFFTVNGITLIYLLKIFRKYDLKYPDDAGIISFEDWDWMELVNPGITSIKQNSYKMGQVAANRLIEKIENNSDLKHETLEIKSEFIVRGSL